MDRFIWKKMVEIKWDLKLKCNANYQVSTKQLFDHLKAFCFYV